MEMADNFICYALEFMKFLQEKTFGFLKISTVGCAHRKSFGKILIRFAYKNRPAYSYLYKYTGLLFCRSDILRNTTSLRLIKNFANFTISGFLLLKEHKPLIFL